MGHYDKYRIHRHGAPSSRRGANVGEWVDKNKRVLLVAGIVVLVGIVAYALWMRQQAATPAPQSPAATEVPETPAVASGASAQLRRHKKKGKKAYARSAAAVADASLCDAAANLPKPANVYEDDLSAANAVGDNGDVKGVGSAPVDYAGACSGVNPSAVWQSSQLLPTNCGQSLEGTSDWSLYAPSNYQVTSFLSAGFNNGQDTVMTTLKNASLDLRPEPVTPACTQVPFNQSSWVDNSLLRTDWSHSLVA